MAKIRHRVEHDGQVFTRNSANRTYRYAVLGPVSLAHDLARAEEGARYSWKQNQDYHQKYVDGTSRFIPVPSYCTTDSAIAAHQAKVVEQIEESRAWLAGGLDGLIADYRQHAEIQWRRHFPKRDAGWCCRGWCSRLDLAQKLADPCDLIVAAVIL